MRLTLGLSGLDGERLDQRRQRLDQLAPPAEPSEAMMQAIAEAFRQNADLDARRAGGEDARRGAGRLRGAEQARAARAGDPRPAARRVPLAAGDAGDALGRGHRPGEPGDGRGPRDDGVEGPDHRRHDRREGPAARSRPPWTAGPRRN